MTNRYSMGKLSIITLFERNHSTFEQKQIIDEGSNLLNKIIKFFFSHRTGLARWPDIRSGWASKMAARFKSGPTRSGLTVPLALYRFGWAR